MLLIPTIAAVGLFSHLSPVRPRVAHAPVATAVNPVDNFMRDLNSDDWEPLRVKPFFMHPNFLSSCLTGVSAVASLRSHRPLLGIQQVAVLTSSVVYWADPQRVCTRRTVDLFCVRTMMIIHLCLSLRRGCFALPLAYAAGGGCYAIGRVLAVRDRLMASAIVHSGVSVFANLGNLALIRTPVL